MMIGRLAILAVLVGASLMAGCASDNRNADNAEDTEDSPASESELARERPCPKKDDGGPLGYECSVAKSLVGKHYRFEGNFSSRAHGTHTDVPLGDGNFEIGVNRVFLAKVDLLLEPHLVVDLRVAYRLPNGEQAIDTAQNVKCRHDQDGYGPDKHLCETEHTVAVFKYYGDSNGQVDEVMGTIWTKSPPDAPAEVTFERTTTVGPF